MYAQSHTVHCMDTRIRSRRRPTRRLTHAMLIVIVISKLLKRYSKAKRTRAPAYSRALRRIKGGFPKEVRRSSGPISRVPGGDRDGEGE